ncbi:hypothetical protein, partial [Chryseobacterium indoltheticum]|uniref:hypothetical protein n=1 Tax=Chryseobacterium indoltheticum TaxID=254 RepID=UPI0028E9E4E1
EKSFSLPNALIEMDKKPIIKTDVNTFFIRLIFSFVNTANLDQTATPFYCLIFLFMCYFNL